MSGSLGPTVWARRMLVSAVLAGLVLVGCEPDAGPLTLVSGPGGDNLTLHGELFGTGGTLLISEDCVVLQHLGPQPNNTSLLIWPADRTEWRPSEAAIAYERLTGEMLLLRHGDSIEVAMSDRALEA